MSGEEVAKAFVQHFYSAYARGPNELAGLYVGFTLSLRTSAATEGLREPCLLPEGFISPSFLLLQSPQSMLTFEGQQVMGSEQIVQKLSSIGKVQHDVKSMDVQPSQNPNAMIIFVTGTVRIDNGNPLHFCEVCICLKLRTTCSIMSVRIV